MLFESVSGGGHNDGIRPTVLPRRRGGYGGGCVVAALWWRRLHLEVIVAVNRLLKAFEGFLDDLIVVLGVVLDHGVEVRRGHVEEDAVRLRARGGGAPLGREHCELAKV